MILWNWALTTYSFNPLFLPQKRAVRFQHRRISGTEETVAPLAIKLDANQPDIRFQRGLNAFISGNTYARLLKSSVYLLLRASGDAGPGSNLFFRLLPVLPRLGGPAIILRGSGTRQPQLGLSTTVRFELVLASKGVMAMLLPDWRRTLIVRFVPRDAIADNPRSLRAASKFVGTV